MNIGIHGNLQSQSVSPVKPKVKTEGKEFSLPHVTEAGVVEGPIKQLPESLLNKSEERKKEMEYKGTPFFVVNEDGSFTIREGLTPADYARALATIRSWQLSEMRGGGIS